MIWFALLALAVLLIWGASWVLKELVELYKYLNQAYDFILNLQRRLGEAEQIIADRIGDLR